ncbi:hypothetical protein [Tropicibacter sp. S64]|uniref:hypothetical protein n=1 Tax=Tropicibacter sp. S64 TaxID=3415122 RepID=UPI003C79AEF1
MKTKLFGDIAFDDHDAVLPAQGPLTAPVPLDMDEMDLTPDAVRALAGFLDSLPAHLEAIEARFIADYDEIADFVPGWLAEELPEEFSRVFGGMKPETVGAKQLWSILRLTRIWASEQDTVVLDFQMTGFDVDHMLGVYMTLDGAITEIGIES